MARGRPREFDADAALDGAVDLFWRRGYRATSTRDLERALGVAQSSLYNAFGSKAELLDLALARYQARIDRALLDPLREDAEGLASVDRFLGGLCDWLVADGTRGCMVGRMMGEGADVDASVAARLVAYRQRLISALRAALDRAVARGEIPADSVSTRIEVLRAGVLGLNLAVLAGYGPEEVRSLGEALRAEVAGWAGDGEGEPVVD